MTLARLRLARTEGVGPVTFRRLMARFGDAGAALAELPALARAAGRSATPRIPPESEAAREIDGLSRLGAALLFAGDAAYPPHLEAAPGAPAVLSVLGDPNCLSARAVALVGARNASANGQRLAELLAADLAAAGIVVVSGLARGIDAAAHRGAARAGRTVAAVAGGLDQPYPPENAALQALVAANGAVVAEAPLGTAPIARHFPRRNRVIAGLSLAVLVVEAAPKSGSLITARIAAELNRPLFAAPGSPLDPRCRGSNDLIRGGATLTETAADILPRLPAEPLPAFGLAEPGAAAAPPFTPGEAEADPLVVRLRLDELIGPDPVPVDDLLRRCQFSPSAILGALGELEAEGVVQTVGGQVLRMAD